MKRLVSVIAAAVFVAPASAQTSVALTKPDAEFPEPFTRLRGLRETPNGKLLVSDLQDKVVQLVDFASGTMTKVGREGLGPGEYALPSDLFAMPNGETWLNDMLGRRYLVIGPDGKPGRTVPLPGTGGGPGPGFGFGLGGGGSDGTGRLYFQAPPFNPQSPDGEAPDSLAILRWETSKSSMDTVAWMKGPKGSVTATSAGGATRFSMRIGGGKEFTPQDAWGVAGDGAVARVTPNPYRVVWYAGGKAAPGPPVPYTPLQVTEADKQQVIEARKRSRPMMVMIGPGGRSGQPPAGGIQLPDPEFEETKPPFSGVNSVLVTPEGEAWVLRTRPASDKAPSYDVFDRTGKLARKVTLNPNSRVAGFGKGTVYVIRTDEDDLQYIQRYRR
ncbi:MAG: hypothetical protein ACKVZ0_24065 [Gemmatimonadales bacterium]